MEQAAMATELNTEQLELISDAIIKTLNQNEPALADAGCAYRADQDCCVIGHMVKDEHYTEDMEGHPVGDTEVADPLHQSRHNTLIQQALKHTLNKLETSDAD